MPYITFADVPDLKPIPGQSVISTAAVTTAFPELFRGLQFWLTPEAYLASGVVPFTMKPDASGNYYASLIDQSGRLTWTDNAGATRHDAFTTYSQPNQQFMPTLLAPAAGVAGHAAIAIDRTVTGLGVPASFNQQTGYKAATAALLTDDFTLISYGSSSADAVGGIFSTGDATAAMGDATCGMRLGFASGATNTVIYQNTPAAADRCTLAVPIAADAPLLMVARGTKNLTTGKYDGSLAAVTGGVVRSQAYSFTNPIKWDGLASPTMVWGSQDSGAGTAAGNKRKLQTGARWNRSISDGELAYLIRWFQAVKGLR